MADVCPDMDSNDPHELYARGIRALILQNYEAASAIISRAAELFVAHYKDDRHEEMGKVYLDYGKALLGYSREQSGALGVAMVPIDPLDEAKGIDVGVGTTSDEIEDSECEAESQDEPKEAEPQDDLKEPAGEASCSAEPNPSTDEAEISMADEGSDLQLAWEVLELSKGIFEKSGDRKSLADALIVLGEIQLENAAYVKAIEDMKRGLAIQKELFATDSRTIAETLYKLGMAYCVNAQLDEAIESFKDSLAHLTNRIEALAAEDVANSEDEIAEIKGLLPEIKERIAEMESCKCEALKKAAEKITETSSSAASDPSPSSSKKASDISHLVKRKRQSEEVDKLSEEAACKKRAVEGKN